MKLTITDIADEMLKVFELDGEALGGVRGVVEAAVPTGGSGEFELMMAVWTPGSYLVREYARNVEGVVAKAGDGNEMASLLGACLEPVVSGYVVVEG